MVKLIIGAKGSGKTKVLVESANDTIATTNGTAVFIAKGKKLIHEVKYQVRFIDTDEYRVDNTDKLFGLVAGVISYDYDAHDIFVDSALKIIGGEVEALEKLIVSLDTLAAAHSINIVVTSSVTAEELTETLKKYVA